MSELVEKVLMLEGYQKRTEQELDRLKHDSGWQLLLNPPRIGGLSDYTRSYFSWKFLLSMATNEEWLEYMAAKEEA